MRLLVARALALTALVLAPNAAEATSIAFDKGPIVLGRTTSIGITVKVDEPAGTEDRPLQLAVNVGSFGPVTRQGPGTYRATYSPPSTRFPQVALVAVWRETGAEAPIDFLRVPLHGATRLPVRAKRGSQVTVEIGPEKFGPEVADKKGEAEVPVIIPPGVGEAVIVVQEPRGSPTRATIPISVAPYNRLTAALVPHALVADGDVNARIDVYYDLGGADVPPDRIRVKASLGDAVFEQADHGRYSFRYTPPVGVAGKKVKFDISVDGDAAAKANTEVLLGLSPPSRVILRPPENQLVADGRSSGKVIAQVFDASGLGLAKLKVELSANGRALSPLVDKGDGRYEATFTAPAQLPSGGLVLFAASAADGANKVTTQQNYRLRAPSSPKSLLVQLEPDVIPADGHTQAVVQLEVRDEEGAPLKGVRLTSVASHGSISPITELGNGRYQSTYTAPPGPPPTDATLTITDASGMLQQGIALRLRADPRKVHVGIRGGLAYNLGNPATEPDPHYLFNARTGLDALFPFRVANNYMAVIATLGVVQGAQHEGVAERSVVVLPATVRLMYEAVLSPSLSLYAGAGIVGGIGLATNSISGVANSAYTLPPIPCVGALAGVAGAYRLGPGHGFVELAFGLARSQSAPVLGAIDVNNLPVGGLSLEAGYRIALF